MPALLCETADLCDQMRIVSICIKWEWREVVRVVDARESAVRQVAEPAMPLGEPRLEALSAGSQLLVWSMRRWLIAAAKRERVSEALAQPYRMLHCESAVGYMDECLALAVLAALHPMTIRCLGAPTLSADEALIWRSMQRMERGDEAGALHLAQGLIAGRLAGVFVRSADLYVGELGKAGIPLASTPDLRLV